MAVRLLAALAVFVGVLALAPAASATHVQCGDVITQDTTLDTDLTCSGDGLTIAADDVTVDFAGHTIRGNGGGAAGIRLGFPAPSDFRGAEVRGGSIESFSYGVAADGPKGSVVRSMTLERNGIGFNCNYAPECRIESSVVRNSGTGVRFAAVDQGCESGSHVVRNRIHNNVRGVRLAGCNATVAENIIEQNSARGLSIEDHGRVEVSDNLVARNGEDGIYATYQATLEVFRNRILRNGADGIFSDGGIGEYGVAGGIHDNRISLNAGDGVHAAGPNRAVIARNRTDRNGDDGIDIDLGEFGHATVRANRASFNADLGIEADPGTTDGGGNKAKHNGNPTQCVGVVCE